MSKGKEIRQKRNSDNPIHNSDEKAYELKRQMKEESTAIEQRKYSVFNYLKKTPSVFIALLSACAAIATFVAKIAAANSMKAILSFWKFDLSYLNYDNSSLLFPSLVTFLYLLLFGLVTFWFESCQRSMLQHRKYLYENKRLRNRLKEEKNSKNEATKKDIDEKISGIETTIKRNRVFYWRLWFLSMIVTCIIAFFAAFLYMSVTSTLSGWKYWASIVLSLLFQLMFLRLMSALSNRKDFSKRKIRQKHKRESIETLTDAIKEPDAIEHPFLRLNFKGVRSFFDNADLVLCALLIMLNSIMVCTIPFMNTKQYTWKKDEYRIVNMEETTYVIILQDNNRYYLERAEIVTSKENAETRESSGDISDSIIEQKEEQIKTVLNVYLNEQRVVVLDDISYELQKFDDVVKIESGDANK